MKKIGLLAGACLLFLCGCAGDGITGQTEAKKPEHRFLGKDVLWRPRENLVFYLYNDSGKGFDLNLTVRDLNTYTPYPARLLVQVIDPEDQIVLRKWIEDDGIVYGNNGKNFKYQDGIYDPYADYQYRQYHVFNSPGGYPPEKERNPYLEHPEKLPARAFSFAVPGKGKGTYRVFLTGCWDHFVSIDTSRRMPAAVHPGTGPLAAVGKTLEKSFLFYPAESQDLCWAVTEETLPWTAKLTLRDPAGKVLRQAKASGFCTYMMPEITKKDAVYELDLEGIRPGLCVTVRGIPQIHCPDRKTAELFRGALYRDRQNKPYHMKTAAVFSDWAYSLTPKDLDPGVKLTEEQKKKSFKGNIKYGYIEKILKSQILDKKAAGPKGSTYGVIPGAIIFGGNYLGNYNLISEAFLDRKNGENPYYHNPALLRRLYLAEFQRTSQMTPGFRFLQCPPNELVFKRPAKVKTFWDVDTRSNWYALGEGTAKELAAVIPFTKGVIPENVVNACTHLYRLWVAGRWNMHAAEVANQWGYNIQRLLGCYELLKDEELKKEMARHQDMLMTPEYFGRQNPDITPYDKKHGKPDADVGISNAGYITEHWGFDGEYGCQQEWLWGEMWNFFPNPKTIAWFDKDVQLKSHMMTPRTTRVGNVFDSFANPTDYNSRTRGLAHKMNVPGKHLGKVKYLDLWRLPKEKQTSVWPALQKGDFIHSFADKFYFVKRGDFYTTIFTGPRQPLWTAWAAPVVSGDSISFQGKEEMGYGGWGHAQKPGLISGIRLNDSGIIWLGTNHSVKDPNTVWGIAEKPIFKSATPLMENDHFAACYAPSVAEFDVKNWSYTLKEKIPWMPFAVESRLRFETGKIAAEVKVTALESVRVKEMHYTFPVVEDFVTPGALLNGKSQKVNPGKGTRQPDMMIQISKADEMARIGKEIFRADTLVYATKNGKQVHVKLNAPQTFRMLAPLQYRHVAPMNGGFVMDLPRVWKKGDVFRFTFDVSKVGK